MSKLKQLPKKALSVNAKEALLINHPYFSCPKCLGNPELDEDKNFCWTCSRCFDCNIHIT